MWMSISKCATKVEYFGASKLFCKWFNKGPLCNYKTNRTDSGYTDWSVLSSKLFWEKKYKGASYDEFDWLVNCDKAAINILQEIESMKLNKSSLDILDLGCGFSNVSKRLLELSHIPIHIVCLDFVREALLYQKHSLNSTPSDRKSYASFVTGDCCKLPFINEAFDVIFDKGTVDSMLKNDKTGIQYADDAVTEGVRTLRQGGILVQITDEDPDCRSLFLETIFRNHGFQYDVKYRCLGVDYGIEKNIFVVTK